MDDINYSDRLIAFIDVLGFRNLVDKSANDSDESSIILKRMTGALYHSVERLRKDFSGRIQFTHFSDSFAISTAVSPKQCENHSFVFALMCVIDEFLMDGMLLRGGITQGKLIHTDTYLFGPAMNRACHLESLVAKFPRIILDTHVADFSEHNMVIDFIRSDCDGHRFIDYFRPQKMFYLVPSWLLAIKQIIKAMPNRSDLRENRQWLVERYNEAVGKFSFNDFKIRLTRRADEQTDIAMYYYEYLNDAKKLVKIRC